MEETVDKPREKHLIVVRTKSTMGTTSYMLFRIRTTSNTSCKYGQKLEFSVMNLKCCIHPEKHFDRFNMHLVNNSEIPLLNILSQDMSSV